MRTFGMQIVKYVLVAVNILFLLAGIGLMVAGGLALNASSQHLADSLGRGPAVAVIVLGVFVFITAFLGSWGAFKENGCMLISFSAILIVIFIAQLSTGISAAVYRDSINDELEREMLFSMNHYTEDAFTREAWSAIQISFHCCGVTNEGDWKTRLEEHIPASCCPKHTGDIVNEYCEADEEVYQKGCFPPLMEFIKNSLHAVMVTAIVIAFLELAGAFLACFLAQRIKKDTSGIA